MLGRNDRRGGTGFYDSHRELPGRFNRGDPPARQHDKQFSDKTERFQTGGKPGQIFGCNRLDIGIGCRGAGPLIFADLGQYFK